ncbi:MAG: hypothetical protein WC438_01070 [Candidatus Pacearchaeota archaeon]
MEEKAILEALKKLRAENKERKFNQTVDLLINLRKFDVRKSSFSLFASVPHKIKEKKIAAFLEKQSKLLDTITKDEFGRFKEKKDLRKLRQYDTFIANAKLMPAIATSFGRVLGAAGKMPSPQLGILPNEEDATIKKLMEKVNSTVRVRVKEPSIKIPIGKESMNDKDIAENIEAVYSKILENLPSQTENVKNVMIKFTMTKPVKIM